MIPPENVRAALELKPNEKAIEVKHLGKADDVPMRLGTNYFLPASCPDVERIFRDMAKASGGEISLSEALKEMNIIDIHKKDLRVRGRLSDTNEQHVFGISPSEPILEVEVTNVDQKRRLISHVIVCFPTSRVELRVDFK